LADSLYSENLKDGERYLLRQILNQTLRNEIGISYQYINFSGDYSRNKEWNSFSAELQHHFGRTAVLGRTTFSNRGYDEGTLYELEAYPILNDRFYSFVNLGFSNGEIFPEKKASASVFYNFAKVLEAEVGGRILIYDKSSYFSGIIGLTAYTGKFYFNIRSFLGPERSEQLIRNHQFNLRYYISSVDDYLFLRLGTGISPDETALFSRIQQNPTLDASYANIGLQKSISVHHHFQVAAGILHEEITASKTGNQFIGNISYRYRF
jgi:YaiO family outer membrane protein